MIGNIYPSTEWELDKLGKMSSSRIDELLTPPKDKAAKDAGELGQTAISYVIEKASEIMTGTVRQMDNWSLQWGKQYEEDAAAELLVLYPDLEYFGLSNPKFFQLTDFSGGSPDAIVRSKRIIIEIKCPEDPANHVAYCLLKTAEDVKKAKREYFHQIHMNMVCVAKELGCKYEETTGLFASFCPIINEPYKRLHTVTIPPIHGFDEMLLPKIEKGEKLLAEIIRGCKESPSLLIASPIPGMEATIVNKG